MNIREYSDEEQALYEAINWAMIGMITTVNEDRHLSFYGFLADLYREGGGDLCGEPGWCIERIDLKREFGARFPYLPGELTGTLHAMQQGGEDEAFVVENGAAHECICVLSSDTFWQVVSDAFEVFEKTTPDIWPIPEAILLNYPKLRYRSKHG